MAEPLSPTPSPPDRDVRARRLVARAAGWCCLALFTVPGCRNIDNAQLDVLERELRQQEDYIYELEDYLLEYSEKLRQARMESCQPTVSSPAATRGATTKPRPLAGEPHLMDDTTRRPLRGGSPPPAGNSVTPGPLDDASMHSPAEPGATAESRAEESPAEPPAAEAVDPKELEAPDVEIGPGVRALPWRRTKPLADAPTVAASAPSEGPLLIPDPVDYQADAEPTAARQAAAPARTGDIEPVAGTEIAAAGPELAAQPTVARLTPERLEIRRVFGEPSAEEPTVLGRMMVVVEALNATNEPTDVPGEISLMVLARDEAGELKWIDRWDFTAEETAAAWQSSHLGDGLHLELPLDRRALPAGELQLWARLVDAEGQRLLASTPFDAAKLTSIEDAADNTALAATAETMDVVPSDAAEPVDGRAEAAGDAEPLVESAAPSAWKATSRPIDVPHVEGFASTAAGGPKGWSTAAGAATPRVARAASQPSWQKGTPAPPGAKEAAWSSTK
jgi:hypothetical protein